MVVRFQVKGKPKGKERPRLANGVVYTPKGTTDYERDVQIEYLRQVGGYQLKGAIEADIEAFFEYPKAWSKKRREQEEGMYYQSKPDVDNIAKIILDALNKVAYKDDAAVSIVKVTKRYGEESKVIVQLTEI